jgi:hypothetical protein
MFLKRLWFPGISKRPTEHKFFLWGKHRSFRDYISITGNNTVIHKLAAWAQREKTVTALNRYAQNRQDGYWYYWMVEDRILHLGLMMTSCDISGRPNLLIISGYGPMMAVNQHWERINAGSLATWSAMIQIGRENVLDMNDLNNRLAALPWPESGLEGELDIEERRLTEATEKIRHIIQADKQRCLRDKTVRIQMPDNDRTSDEDLAWPVACQQIMQMRPNSLFWGAVPGKKIMILFFREIVETDFIDFWEIGNN